MGDEALVMEDLVFDPVEGESTPAVTGVAQLAREEICIASDVQPPIEEFPFFNVRVRRISRLRISHFGNACHETGGSVSGKRLPFMAQ